MKNIIQTDKAPAPIGPYSQAVMAGNVLYTSGQIAINPATGKMNDADVETESKQVMQNLEAVLKAAGMDFSHVVKSSIFLKDMGDFQKVNSIYAKYFDEAAAPARETVQVAQLPKDVRVEISMIATK